MGKPVCMYSIFSFLKSQDCAQQSNEVVTMWPDGQGVQVTQNGLKIWDLLKCPPKRKRALTKKLQVHPLHDLRVKNNLQVMSDQVMLEERLHSVTAAEPEEKSKHMKTMLQETTAEVAF